MAEPGRGGGGGEVRAESAEPLVDGAEVLVVGAVEDYGGGAFLGVRSVQSWGTRSRGGDLQGAAGEGWRGGIHRGGHPYPSGEGWRGAGRGWWM